MSDVAIEIGSEWVWTNNDGEVEVWVIDVATNEHGETLITTEEADGEIQYDDMDYFLENYKPKADMVNHPPHYKDASGIECIEVTSKMSFCGGNCFKYLYRAGSKGDLLEDLKKAMWYADYARVHEGRIGLFQRLKISKNIKTISKHRYYRISSVMDLILSRDWTWVATEIEYLIRDIELRESLRGEKVTLKNAGSNL